MFKKLIKTLLSLNGPVSVGTSVDAWGGCLCWHGRRILQDTSCIWPEVWRSRPEVWRCLPEVWRSRPEVWRSRPEVWRSRPEVWRSRPEVWRSRPEVWRSRPEVWRFRPELRWPRPEVWRSRPEVWRSRPELWQTRCLERPLQVLSTGKIARLRTWAVGLLILHKNRILRHQFDKRLEYFATCYSQSFYWRIFTRFYSGLKKTYKKIRETGKLEPICE